jgi:hypothetical protein
VELATIFVNHTVDENPQATERQKQKLARKDEREAQRRKNEEAEGEKRAAVEFIFDLYEHAFSKSEIKKLLEEHK